MVSLFNKYNFFSLWFFIIFELKSKEKKIKLKIYTRQSQQFCNILVQQVCGMYINYVKQFKPSKLSTEIGSIMVAGVLTYCVLFHCVGDLK